MIDYTQIPSPCYVLDEKRLRRNLELLKRVQVEADIDIILAFKGFSMWSAFPMVRQYLAGATASSLYEARLCFEEMKQLSHTYSAVFFPYEFEEIMQYSSHISFNSLSQFQKFYPSVSNFKGHKISCGLRVNPELSVVETDLYNPCTPGSRLGETRLVIGDTLPEGIEGLHVHALCESSAYDSEQLILQVEKMYGQFFPQLKWLNFGGGHLMTRAGYDVEHLIAALKGLRTRHPHLHVILEPGSAIAWQTGELVSTVHDIHDSFGIKTLMTDVSFTAHMPDTLEMPYRPRITGATDPVEGKPTYRIGGTSCLSGDFMLEYSFDAPVKEGDLLIFEDMIHYTMVKTSMFNGVQHPSIGIWREDDTFELVRKFSYEDFKNRLS